MHAKLSLLREMLHAMALVTAVTKVKKIVFPQRPHFHKITD
jgi:hypothetical protein